MLRIIKKGVSKLNNMLNKPEEKSPNNLNYLEYIVKNFSNTPEYKNQKIGLNYYKGKHDILNKKKEVIGVSGELEPIDNVPCNKRIDNQYAIAVDKKVNYLLGRNPTYRFKDKIDEPITEDLSYIFTDNFNRVLKNILKDGLNCGIGYMYIFLDEESNFKVKRLNPLECKPIWKDEDKQELDFLVRVYVKNEFINGSEIEVNYCEVYDPDKLTRYKILGSTLIKITEIHYIRDFEGKSYSWGKVPIIPFRCNSDGTALIEKVKNLQDGLNEILSNFNDCMEENPRNSILIIHNYDGQELGEFRKNLNTYGAVKVRHDGGVNALNVEVNATNYLSIMQVFKNAIIENAKSYDAKDDRMSNNPNMMNIQSMYSDIDIDSNGIETEYMYSFSLLTEFIKKYLITMNVNIRDDSEIVIIFNKDVLINESQVISDIRNSFGLLSNETLIENHPYIDDVSQELERLNREKQEQLNLVKGNLEDYT